METPNMIRFNLAPVDELQLQRAPLAKVLMQVRYSRTPSLVTDDAEERIAEALSRYPVRRRQITAGFVPGVVINGQPVQLQPDVSTTAALTFSDPKAAWQVTVTDTAVALETTDYDNRQDFCDRAEEVFRAIASVALPPVVDRVGIRYIDRLTGGALEDLESYVIPQLLGLSAGVEPPLVVQHSITESQVEIAEDERMLVRAGVLPPNTAFDPALPPLSETAWVLDMDVFTIAAGFAFDPQLLRDRLHRYAEAIYAFFRFATTDRFQQDHRTTDERASGR